MKIIASNNGQQRELIPAGNYIARCWQMIHIGTVLEYFKGEEKIQNRVRIGFELPTELKVFKEENGEQPLTIDKEFTLSMHEKANLRKMLASWRGKDFNKDEAERFDITKLIGAPCMLNIIHKPSKDGSKTYQDIAGISPMPKKMVCPEAINKPQVLAYDDFDYELFDKLPDFIKTKIKTSDEYNNLLQPQAHAILQGGSTDIEDELLQGVSNDDDPEDWPF